VWVISGTTPQEISQWAEGRHRSPLSGNINYEQIGTRAVLYQAKGYFCSIDMLEYVKGANIAFDHIHKEIVISNPDRSYSWVFSLQAKAWYKISGSWVRFVTDYPNVYGYYAVLSEGSGDPILASSTEILASDDEILASSEYSGETVDYRLADISREDYSANVTIHFETRPIKLSPGRWKKIHRLLIEGRLFETSQNPFSVHLFGTGDGFNYYKLNSSTGFYHNSRVLLGRTTNSAMYFIVVAGGRVPKEAFITNMLAEFEDRYATRLR
jgi:hypothetical protein